MTSNIGGDKGDEFNFVQGKFPDEEVVVENTVNEGVVKVNVTTENKRGEGQPYDSADDGLAEIPKAPEDLEIKSFFGDKGGVDNINDGRSEERDTEIEIGVGGGSVHVSPEIPVSDGEYVPVGSSGGVLDLGDKKITVMGGVEHVVDKLVNNDIKDTLSDFGDVITPGEEGIDNNTEVSSENGENKGIEDKKDVGDIESSQKSIILSKEGKKSIAEIDELLLNKEKILKGLKEGGVRVGGAIDILGGGDVTVLKNETEDVNAQILKLQKEKDDIIEKAETTEAQKLSGIEVVVHQEGYPGAGVFMAIQEGIVKLNPELDTKKIISKAGEVFSGFAKGVLEELKTDGRLREDVLNEYRAMVQSLEANNGVIEVTVAEDGKLSANIKNNASEIVAPTSAPEDLTDGVADDYDYQKAA